MTHIFPRYAMRFLSALAFAACTAATPLMADAPHAAPAPEQISIPTDNDHVLHALLYKPDGDGPFPTVLALHGCDGLTGNAGQIRPRYRDWAEHLLKAGNAVLFPDSYGSRGLGSRCQVKDHPARARRGRVHDVLTSRQWLIDQPWVVHNHIGLLGWAKGANALLWAVRPQLASRDSGPDFRSAVAFYPGCQLASRLGWSARVPTLVLIGANDDLSSPAACREMIDDARGRSALARVVVYPGADHQFDHAHGPLQANAAIPVRRHRADSKARTDAQKRVIEWLAR
jgi:dienelactone hydrolase